VPFPQIEANSVSQKSVKTHQNTLFYSKSRKIFWVGSIASFPETFPRWGGDTSSHTQTLDAPYIQNVATTLTCSVNKPRNSDFKIVSAIILNRSYGLARAVVVAVPKEARVLSGRSLQCLARQIAGSGLALGAKLEMSESTISGMAFDRLAAAHTPADVTYRMLVMWKRRAIAAGCYQPRPELRDDSTSLADSLVSGRELKLTKQLEVRGGV